MARQSYVLKKLPSGKHELVPRDELSAWLDKHFPDRRSSNSLQLKPVERGSWVVRDGKLIPRSEDIGPAHRGRGLQVIKDIEPYQNVAIDGGVIGGRKQHRDMLRAHGCVEVGNEKPVQRTYDERAHERSIEQSMRRVLNG